MKFLVPILASVLFSNQIFAGTILSREEPIGGYKYLEKKENLSSMYDMDDENACYSYDDPFEKINRPFFYVNGALDYIILRPVATAYKKVLPSKLRGVIGNFVDNLTIPFSIINNILQFEFKEAGSNLCVFAINSVWGLGGIVDIVGDSGLKHKKQGFGDTLAHYGVAPGPYLMVPFFGPSNARDLMDILFKGYIEPVGYVAPKALRTTRSLVKLVHDRSLVIGNGEDLITKSADPYVAFRSLQYQQRESSVKYIGKRPKCDPAFYKAK
jgi:phospholipid-binding lipoprotein MlaA